jgi:acyl-coenzyme A thioesterase PaaI-like protein
VVIATATRADVPPIALAPPTPEEASAAELRFVGLARHIFPGCFVCGPEREEGDGLRIFAGPAGGQVASTWCPGPDLADEAGDVRCAFVWAALDCPGYFAVQEAAGLAVLGTMSAVRLAPVRAGEIAVVTGWTLGSEGRKHRAGTAVHDADGRLLAAAQATWITLRPAG